MQHDKNYLHGISKTCLFLIEKGVDRNIIGIFFSEQGLSYLDFQFADIDHGDLYTIGKIIRDHNEAEMYGLLIDSEIAALK